MIEFIKRSSSAAVVFLLIFSLAACGSSTKNTDMKVSGIPDPKEIETLPEEPTEEPSMETPSLAESAAETLPSGESYESSLYVAEIQEDREIPTSYWVTFYDDYTGYFLRSIDGYVREELEEFDFTWEMNDSGAPTAHKNGGGDVKFSPVEGGILMEDRGIVLTRSSAKIGSKTGKNEEDNPSSEESSLSPELQTMEKELQSSRYNGFLTEEYTKPGDINWAEVFYVGAGLYLEGEKLSKINDELMKAYMEETGTDESEFEDFSFDVYEGQVIRDFVKGTSGFSAEEVADKLGLTYFKKWDVYAGTGAGDTNMVGIKVLSGEKDDDGIYTVKYENNGQPFKVRVKENGEYLQFFSNEWDPADGRTSAIHSYYTGAIQEFEKEHDTKDLGYWLYDIDGDGTVELFIGKVRKGDKDGSIDRMYYIRMGELSECAEIKGDDKNRFYIAKDDTLYEANVNSSGKKRIVHYNVDGLGSVIMLFPIDQVLYDKKGENGEENPWYYAKGNGFVKEKISEKEFEDYRINAGNTFRNPEYIPLSEWVR